MGQNLWWLYICLLLLGILMFILMIFTKVGDTFTGRVVVIILGFVFTLAGTIGLTKGFLDMMAEKRKSAF